MIIDCHAHYEPRIIDIDGIFEKMEHAGVDKTVLIPLLTDPPETKKADIIMAVQRFMLYAKPLRPLAIAITETMYKTSGEWNMWYRKYSSETQKFHIVTNPDNKTIADLVEKYPDRLMGWIFINPTNDDSLEQLERWRSIPGMIGVKIHPFWHRFSMEVVDKVAKRTEELGLPMLIHLGSGDQGNYMWLIERFPNLTIIFAHLGIPFFKDLWVNVKNRSNIFMDVSSTYHVNKRFIRDAVRFVGPRKCLFGTDSPYAHDDAVHMIKGWVENLAISDRDKERIFSDNFKEIISRII